MKLRLPSRLVQALLTTCAVALSSTPAFADVPEGYTPVTITSASQLSSYENTDYIAFIIGADITDNAYKMEGSHQYWADASLQSHILTFTGLRTGILARHELAFENFYGLCFSLNSSSSGGAIGAFLSYKGAFNIRGNGSVAFSANTASESVGGAIYVWSYPIGFNLSDNGDVAFTENSAATSGGAIYSLDAPLNMLSNESMVFSGNSAQYGGAIYSSNVINVTGNGSVSFSGNNANEDYYSSGGAIYSINIVNLTENDELTFSGNRASAAYDATGGAIYSFGTINVRNNKDVLFEGNSVSDAEYMTLGGAIYSDFSTKLNIEGNEHVVFRGNYEEHGGFYRMRSVYTIGSSLTLAAGTGQDITFYDTLYAKPDRETMTVSFNADYEDAAGQMQKADGKIVFSGLHTKEDLLEIKGGEFTQEELSASLTTEVYATTNLYGGCLSVEDGAIYKGNGIDVAAESGATLALHNATLDHLGYSITLNTGSTLALEGVNAVMANRLAMTDGSTLGVNLGSENATSALLSLSGDWALGGGLNIDVTYDEAAAAAAPLRILDTYKDGVPMGWDAQKVSVSGTTFDKLQWSDGILYLNLTGGDIPQLTTIEWKGGDKHWNYTSANWEEAGASTIFVDGDKVRFSGRGGGDVTLDTALAPRNVLVEGSNSYDFGGSGSLTGQMQLVKNGTGLLSIHTENDYTGGTILNGGLLIAGSATAFGVGSIQINGGTLGLGGYTLANYVSAENADVVISDGSLHGGFEVSGGSVSLSGVKIETLSLDVAHAGGVSFSDARSDYDGGAISGDYASSIKLYGNNTVSFSNNSSNNYGGAIYGGLDSVIDFTDNGSVSFSGNYSGNIGGAIYTRGAIDVRDNGSVTFNWNFSSYDGGAIFSDSEAPINIEGNDEVSFSYNSTQAEGGAICASWVSPINIVDNDEVTFSSNTAQYGGGAIFASTINLTNNGDVAFSGNSSFGGSGGAISAIIDLRNNGNVAFSENFAHESGGAIEGILNLLFNDAVTFNKNYTHACGGAIYADSLNVTGNGHVTFQGNYEEQNGLYRLRSVHVTGNSLILAAGEQQDITFYDTLYAKSYNGKLAVSFNAAFEDENGGMQDATGDIVFSGKNAEADLIEIKGEYTPEELSASLTTEVYATTNLYGGRLRVEDGVIYKGYGINVAENSGATLLLANGSLEQAGYDVVLNAGTILDLAGENNITASSLVLKGGSSVKQADGTTLNIGETMSLESRQASEMAITCDTVVSASKISATEGMGLLENVNMSTAGNYTIENMTISGSLIDVGKNTTMYLVNVEIKSDTRITDEAAWLDMEATHGWLDERNATVTGQHLTTEESTLYLTGKTSQSLTMTAGSTVVELTSSMFDTVTLTGTDLWLDMQAIAGEFKGTDYVALDFRDLAHELSNAQVDVDKLKVYATLDGEKYLEAYSTANGGLTTTLYFQVPEPTTGTLSLLTLAALAARRKKK